MSLMHHPNTFVSLLAELARDNPELPLYTFLDSAQNQSAVLTSRGLLRKAQQIAALLQQRELAGKPVMVLSAHGPEFMEMLFGVMLAGCIPVPVTFHRRLGMANIVNVIAETGLCVVLGKKETLENLKAGRFKSTSFFDAKRHHHLRYLAIDRLKTTEWHSPKISAMDVMIYYPGLLSDETISPVAVSHERVLRSIDRLMRALSPDRSDCLLTALDLADGMALLLHILLPVCAGVRSYFLPVKQTLDDAGLWLRATSRYACTMISAPPAVLSLAAHGERAERDTELDLSTLRFVCVGGDYVAPCSVSYFIERYKKIGMSAEKIFSCYGLSAACAYISGRQGFRSFDVESVSCLGLGTPDAQLMQAFDTGDGLVLINNELVCQGRISHRFLIEGQEFQAEHIESVVLQKFGVRGLSRCVALYLADLRQTVLLVECATRQLAEKWQGVVMTMMDAVSAETGCRLNRVILLRPGSLPLSVSGIVLRKSCAIALADGSLMLRLLPVRGK